MLSATLLAALLLAPSAYAGATASHFKPENKLGSNFWNAPSAVDGKMDTCWMLQGESPNRGEWIQLDVPKGEVDKIGIMIGWAKDADTFKDYARVKEVKIEGFTIGDGQALVPTRSANVSFEDKQEWQVVDIDNIPIGQDMFGGKVKISVVDIYDGRDFPNLAVSEVLLYLKEFDATPTVTAANGTVAGHAEESLIDQNPKSFWAATAGEASFTLEASGFGLASVGLTAGPKDYARPKKIEITASGRSKTYDVPDTAGPQWFQIPALTGYTGSAWGEVEVKILETWPGAKSSEVGIAEAALKATTYEGL